MRLRVISKAATAVSLYIRRPFHSMQWRVALQHYCNTPADVTETIRDAKAPAHGFHA